MADTVFTGKFAAGLALLCRLDILVRNEMVQDDCDPVFVKHSVKARFFEFIHRHGGGDVVAKHDIQLRADQLTCGDGIQSCVRRKDLLRHRHSHVPFPPLVIL